MIPTSTNVFARARELVGDTDVAGGDLFTNTLLTPHLDFAVNAMFRALRHANSPQVNRREYVRVAPHQIRIDFDAAGVGDIAAINSVRDRSIGSSGAITALAYNTATGWRVTSAAHGRTTGDLVFLAGIETGPDPEMINVVWPISVVDADNFDLIGSPNKLASTTPYSGSGGVWYKTSGSDWSVPFEQVEGLRSTLDSTGSFRTAYDFAEDAIWIQGDNSERLIELYYKIAPENVVASAANLRVRNSLDYLAHMTAGMAQFSRGGDGTFNVNLAIGVGSASMLDERNPGGLLGSLVQMHAKAARRRIHSQRFRSHRRGI